MHTDFIVLAKLTIFLLDNGLRPYFDLYAPDLSQKDLSGALKKSKYKLFPKGEGDQPQCLHFQSIGPLGGWELYRVVELVGGGSVINVATPSSSRCF